MTEKGVGSMTLPRAVICDLDGTLALLAGREWHEYVKIISDDECLVVASVLWGLWRTDWRIIFLTGRPDTWREHAEEWLRGGNYGNFELVVMRPEGDLRSNVEFKREAVRKIRESYDVQLVLEDLPAAVAMFREEGLVCFHVRDSGFGG